MAALAAQHRQHDAWAVILAGIIAAAAFLAGQSLTQSAQDTGADIPDYAPNSDNPNSPDNWANDNQDDLATSIQDHTGRMLGNALDDGLLIGAGTAVLASAANGLYDQWTGLTGQGDYAGQVAGDLTVLGWGMGEQWGIGQITDSGQWSAEKTWNTMGDNRVRATHDDVDGVTIDASDTFNVGGADLDYPGAEGPASEVDGCRCYLTWALVNQVTGATQDIGGFEGE